MHRLWSISALMLVLCIQVGCASTRKSIIQKTEHRTITTGLFPCSSEKEKAKENCIANMEKMLEQFRKIHIADKKAAIVGDTIAEVAEKGFTICLNPLCTKFRSNTQEYRGIKALEAAGKGNFQQTFSGVEDVQKYNIFLGNIRAHEYREANMLYDSDRLCVNKDESLRYGYDFTLIVLFENGHVSDTLIKGGEVYEPKTEEAFMKCPSNAVGALLGGAGGAAKAASIAP